MMIDLSRSEKLSNKSINNSIDTAYEAHDF